MELRRAGAHIHFMPQTRNRDVFQQLGGRFEIHAGFALASVMPGR